MVTAGGDGTARVWNVHSRSAIEILRGHSDAVYAAAFSPDGRLIVTASADGTARLWDTTEGAITLRSWRVRGADVAFSPKGPLMVIAGPGDVAQVWDAETLRKVGPPLRHQASVTSAAFSPDGKRIVTASSDGSLRIFQPSTGRLLAASEAHCVAVRSGGRQCVPARSASFSPKGNLLLTEDDDGIVRIRGSGNLRLRLAIPTPAGSQATFDPTGRLVVIVKDGHISRFDSKSGRQRPALPQPFVASAAFSPDGKQLVTQDTGGNVTVWNAKTNDSVLTLGSEEENASLGPSSGSPGGSVAFSPTGDLIATATPSGLTRLWEARSGRRLAILPGGPRPVSKIVTSSDDRFILTAGEVGPTLYSCQACLPIDDLLRLGHWTKEELRKPGE